jgi:hypothetical protein
VPEKKKAVKKGKIRTKYKPMRQDQLWISNTACYLSSLFNLSKISAKNEKNSKKVKVFDQE